MKFVKIIGFGFIMAPTLLNGLVGPISEAQQPKVSLASPFSEKQPKRACREGPSIIFTEEQTKEFELKVFSAPTSLKPNHFGGNCGS
jgi:hypothetical protein